MTRYIIQNGELYHHGIPGMKWGIRRYQNKNGSLTLAGRIRQARINKKRKAALEKARQAKTEKKAVELSKQEALQKGNASDVLKFKGQLTNQELQNALTRINLERQLNEISSREIAAGQQKTKTLMERTASVADGLTKVKNLAESSINAYNVAAKINNSFSSNKWKLIDGGETAKKEAKDAADKARKAKLNKLSKEEVLNNAKNMSYEDLKYYRDVNSVIDDIAGKKSSKISRDDVEEIIKEYLERNN